MGAVLGSCVCRKGEFTDTCLHLPRVLGAVSALVCTSGPCRLETLDVTAEPTPSATKAWRCDRGRPGPEEAKGLAGRKPRSGTGQGADVGDGALRLKVGAWGAPPSPLTASLHFSQIWSCSALAPWLISDGQHATE